MRGDDPSAALLDEARQRDAAVGGEDRLRGLDHQLELQRARRQRAPVLERVAGRGERGHLIRRHDLRQGDDEVRRQCAAGPVEEGREKQIEGAQAATLQLLAERFDPDPDRWRQRAVLQGGGNFARRELRVLVLFAVGPVAEAVLEVDPEILHRFPRQFVDDARVDPGGEGGIEAQRRGE